MAFDRESLLLLYRLEIGEADGKPAENTGTIITVKPLEIKAEPKKEAPIHRSQSFNIGISEED